MAGHGFRTEPSVFPDDFAVSRIRVLSGGRLRSSESCVNAPTHAEVWVLRVPPTARVRVRSSVAQRTRVDLAHAGGPPRPIHADLEANVWMDVVVPDLGDRRPWVLGFAAGSDATLDLCLLRRVGGSA
jgi:hypothetical protein